MLTLLMPPPHTQNFLAKKGWIKGQSQCNLKQYTQFIPPFDEAEAMKVTVCVKAMVSIAMCVLIDSALGKCEALVKY